jgi:hypothetical protein
MTNNRLLSGLVTIAATCAFLAIQNHCAALPVDLDIGRPEHRTAFGAGTGTVRQHAQSAGTRRHRSSNRPVAGMVHLGEGATVPSTYSLTGDSDEPQSLLDQVRLDPRAASAAARALSPTSGRHQINLNRKTLTLDAGVYNLRNLRLSRSTLTLTGSGSFVFNISSTFALKSARILLAGGATEANVLFNYTGTRNVTFTGRRRGRSVLHGIILALNARVNLSPGLVVGEIINGNNAPAVQNPPPAAVGVPEGTSSTVLLSLIGLAALVAFRSFVVHPSNR